ncbi:MAG: cardiolipin synthase [Phycisphaerales bacterium]|nr:cardiolipin synthase [Phycisphaerales bacterium]
MPTLFQLALAINYSAAIWMVFAVLRRRGEPGAMLAWIFALLTLPGLGPFLYVVFGETRVYRKASRLRRRRLDLINRVKRWAERQFDTSAAELIGGLPPELQAIDRLGRDLLHAPPVGGNYVEFLGESDKTFAAIENAIASASRHIHMQYYIWQPDQTGYQFRELLIQKARAGIECRLLLDSVGSLRLNRRFTAPMIEAGVQVAFFLPLWHRRRRISLHLRNHRKVTVIDGRDALMGSLNIGDEYRGRLRSLSPWYDSNIRIRGPATLFLQQTFLEDWTFATREYLDPDRYLVGPTREGESIIQILPTGPDQPTPVLTHVLAAAVAAAKSSIRIAMAYFVPDPGIMLALEHAAIRGVLVQIILPTRTDAAATLWAGRSYYPELLHAGVEIYEFDAGMLHSKMVTIDDKWCMLGSANMDARSFRLNFELTALVYDPSMTQSVSAMIEHHRARARRISLFEVHNRPIVHQWIEGVARMMSPLL